MPGATLGSYNLDLIDRLPELPRLRPQPFQVGELLGVRILPADHPISILNVTSYVAASARQSTFHAFRAAVGTVQAFTHGGVAYASTYSVQFLILDVALVEARAIPRAIGIDPGGTPYDYSPAGRIRTRWTLQPITV